MSDGSRKRWWILGLLSLGEVLGMSVWFSASAVSPQLRELWGLSAGQAGWLTTAVQVGFVAGTAVAAALNIADLVPARGYFAATSLLAGAANALLILEPGYPTALVLRFATGFFLAGVYPPAMKMTATWFRSARGFAIGTVVGALTIGKALPYLIRAVEGAEVRDVLLAASGNCAVAAIIVAVGYRDGPHAFERRAFSWRLAGTILRHRPTRLAILGYLGHMWELYAMWTWVPAFVAASVATRAASTGAVYPVWAEDVVAFGAIAAGGLGCMWGGWQADRIGRERLVNLAMAASGVCSLAIGWFFGADPWLLAAIAWAWGFFVVADSAQFSTLVTEVAPRHAVGTALTLQTSMGFLLTVATIQLVPVIVDAAGWRWAFPILALGPAAGIAAIRRLAQVRLAGTAADS
jgi:MFS family permease